MGHPVRCRLLLLIALLLAIVVVVAACTPDITSFEDCARRYPVIDSSPPSCRTPDGRVFVQEVPEPACSSDTDCLERQFCKKGACADLSPDTTCTATADCALHDTDLRLGCCYAGACLTPDYSKNSWVALNSAWLASIRAANCPSARECGPAPGCSSQVVAPAYHAECLNGECAMVRGPPPDVTPKSCGSNEDCPLESFCRNGACIDYDITCAADADCAIYDMDLYRPCRCHPGACQAADYSKETWVALNSAAFSRDYAASANCPSAKECGPSPGCPSPWVEPAYHAECMSGKCAKLPGSTG